MPVRVRYAPSPTGDPHLGNIRTAVFDYLFAKATEGVFIVRQEDTDQSRFVPGSFERILQALHWLDIDPDEGMCLDEQGNLSERGDFGPYTQSQRLPIYQEHAQQLLDSGKAYRCFCTAERLEAMRKTQQEQKLPPRYDRQCRSLSREESDARAAAGESYVIRQALPLEGTVTFNDLIRGEISFSIPDLDDHVLLKSDGFPTYQLANVVDDHLMQITHVIRGEEWLPSAPKNVLLYQAFGWEAPVWVHTPLILGPDKSKLSKRHGAEPVLTYRDRGYLPEAVLNVIAFCGWSPGTEEEFFTKDELIKRFQLEKVQKSPAVFELARMDYVNGWYIRHLPLGEVAERMLAFLRDAGIEPQDSDYLLTVTGVIQERLKRFDEVPALTRFFFERPAVTDAYRQLLVPKKGDLAATLAILRDVHTPLSEQQDWTMDAIQDCLYRYITTHELKNMDVLWPIRAALTGEPASPGAFEMLHVLGKDESLARLQAAVS